MNRRRFLELMAASSAALAAGARPGGQADDVPSVVGVGDVRTPRFYRYDLGFSAPRRLHEMAADAGGSLWCSPLDGRLVRYATATGKVDIVDLDRLTGQTWAGKHLFPVAYGPEIYLCSPAMPDLWVYEPAAGTARSYAPPYPNARIHGGFPIGAHVYFYDIGDGSVTKWNPREHRGTRTACPYRLSGPLIMTFADAERQEIWGSTDGGNDLVRFDTATDRWTGHWHAPDADSRPTPAMAVTGNTMYLKDHLKGRLLTFDMREARWGRAIPIPGFRDWFGWVGGGHLHDGFFYFSHSTWTGGTGSIDGAPHHFIDAWSVFDPATSRFSRLRMPAAAGEAFIASKGGVLGGELYITAVNAREPRNAIVVRSSRVRTP